jgi:hypothetical protein
MPKHQPYRKHWPDGPIDHTHGMFPDSESGEGWPVNGKSNVPYWVVHGEDLVVRQSEEKQPCLP